MYSYLSIQFSIREKSDISSSCVSLIVMLFILTWKQLSEYLLPVYQFLPLLYTWQRMRVQCREYYRTPLQVLRSDVRYGWQCPVYPAIPRDHKGEYHLLKMRWHQ